MSSRWGTGALVAALTILAAVLRVPGLDGGLWYDEIVTLVVSVRQPLTSIVTEFPGSNAHILYSLMAHASTRLLGEHAWTLRLPAYLAGVAAVPALYWLGMQVTDRREALLATALLAVSYHHVWFSQNARGYTALTLSAILVTYVLLRGLSDGGWRWYVTYACLAAGGVYVHLTLAFLVLAHAAGCSWLWFDSAGERVDPRSWRRLPLAFVLAGSLSAILYAPVVPQMYGFFTAAGQPGPQVATSSWAVGEMFRGLRTGLGGGGALAAAVLIGSGLWHYWRTRRLVAVLFVLPGIVMGAAAVLLGLPMRPRFFVFLIGIGLLLMVRGTTVLATWAMRLSPGGAGVSTWTAWLATALASGLIVASLLSLPDNYRFPKQDFEGAGLFVESARSEAEPVLTVGLAAFPYQRYYGKPWEEVTTLERYRSIRSKTPRVWLIYTFPEYLEITTPDLMGAIRRECWPVRRFRGTVGSGDIVVCAAGS